MNHVIHDGLRDLHVARSSLGLTQEEDTLDMETIECSQVESGTTSQDSSSMLGRVIQGVRVVFNAFCASQNFLEK